MSKYKVGQRVLVNKTEFGDGAGQYEGYNGAVVYVNALDADEGEDCFFGGKVCQPNPARLHEDDVSLFFCDMLDELVIVEDIATIEITDA